MGTDRSNPDQILAVDYATGERSFTMDLKIPLTESQCEELRLLLEAGDRGGVFHKLCQIQPEARPYYELFVLNPGAGRMRIAAE